ncbi:MAG: DUF3881 family protein [Lachnospiraceae bacterium]|nr:DUF3881 family protein [Lachnospiraceae bacterium]
MTHAFLRSIGFSEAPNRNQIKAIMQKAVSSPNRKQYGIEEDGTVVADFFLSLGKGIGIVVCGTFDSEKAESFIPEFYFPYLEGTVVSTQEEVAIEGHAATLSFAGVCDDLRLGVTLIFYVQNRMAYIRSLALKQEIPSGVPISLSALAKEGSILMPIFKDQEDQDLSRNEELQHREKLIAARNGDEEAIEDLTMEDMDIYTTISKKLETEDVYTIVDNYFMPYGVECDQYSIMGEIMNVEQTKNWLTGEGVWLMRLSCNDMEFDLCISQADLYGEPQVGRRFKGTVWMQGVVGVK